MKQDYMKRALIFIKTGTIVVLVFMVSGCSSFFQNIDNTISRKKHKNDFYMLEQGRVSLLEGEYEKALHLFKTLSDTTKSKAIAARAGFGESCARLYLAQTEKQYEDALLQWQYQVQTHKKYLLGEDIELIKTPILHIAVSPEEKSAPPPVANPGNEVDRSRQQLLEKDEKIRKLEKKLEVETQKVTALSAFKDRQRDMEQEIESLKEKITALEALDQKIQKKKTEIASPE